MNPDRPLHLYQQLLLLTLDGKRGTPIVGYTQLALAAAVLADWLMAGRISVDDSRRALVTLNDVRDTGDPVFDECLSVAKTKGRPIPLRRLIGRLSRIPQLRHKAAETLCARGILRSDRHLVLGLFPRQVYREVDPRPKQAIVDAFRAVLFSATTRTDARIAMLIALSQGANLLWRMFGAREMRNRKARIDEVIASKAGDDALLRLSKTFRQAVAAGIAANMAVVG